MAVRAASSSPPQASSSYFDPKLTAKTAEEKRLNYVSYDESEVRNFVCMQLLMTVVSW